VRIGSLALTLLVAACQAGGVEILVYGPTDTTVPRPDDIRLYVGFGYGTPNMPLGTQAFTPSSARRGTLWTRDIDAPFDHAQPTGDHPVHFTYASRADGDLITVVAVGMNGGVATSTVVKARIPVPTDHIAVYRIGLNGAAVATPNATAVTQLELWGAARTDQTCVQAVEPNGDITYITSPGDEDCDGYLAGDKAECDDHYYKASAAPSTFGLTCLDQAPASTPPGPRACRFGGLSCDDGNPAGRIDCDIAKPYCAPSSLCDTCADQKDKTGAFDCALDPLGSGTIKALHWECLLPTVIDTATAKRKVCTVADRMSIKLPLTGLAACTGATFHGSERGDLWGTIVDIGMAKYQVSSVSSGGAGCSVLFSALTPPTDLAVFPLGGLFAADLDGTKGVAAQVVFRLAPPTGTPCPSDQVDLVCTQVGGNVAGAADAELGVCVYGT